VAVRPGTDDSESLVTELLAQSRFALLLRSQVISNLKPHQVHQCVEALHQQMSLVPEGDVVIGMTDVNPDDPDAELRPTETGVLVRVEPLFLDRFAVTNAEFHQFVEAGGYEQMYLWDPQIWPAVLDFVDRTGRPGPRLWEDGSYPAASRDHPVVGVSWYEAAAYARWAGKRLPTDAEWVKAGSWPIPISNSVRTQRKLPWGDVADLSRCNLWPTGIGGTVPVSSYPTGASVGGVHQLIGNVWEWTTGDFGAVDPRGRALALPLPMKSIRGGAFDTYFEQHATCQFQSGENPLARRHNVGFRCALSLCDLAPGCLHAGETEAANEDPTPEILAGAEA
jgi:iron(II)-dependent oxidoreductase